MGGGVVWVVGVVVWYVWEVGMWQCEFGFFVIYLVQVLFDGFIGEEMLDVVVDYFGDGGWCEFVGGWQDLCVLFVVFVDDGWVWVCVGWLVVELFFYLLFDEGMFFFYYYDVFQFFGEVCDVYWFQWLGYVYFVYVDVDVGVGLFVQFQVFQCLQYVQVVFVGGDDVQLCVW